MIESSIFNGTGRSAGSWVVGRLDGWLVGWLVGLLVRWLVGIGGFGLVNLVSWIWVIFGFNGWILIELDVQMDE